jgi:hypothetical protein
MRHPFILALLVGLPAAAAFAQPVPLPAFDSVQLRGGGEVVVRHGPVQRVTFLEGSAAVTRVEVKAAQEHRSGKTSFRSSGKNLMISACERRCPPDYKLKIEIVTPKLAALAVDGGGSIRTSGAFPQQGAIGLAVSGGGVIDARQLPAASVGAAIRGGGLINTHAVQSLGASINGGGAIRYWGDPSVGSQVNGGGAITRGEGR